MGNEISTNYSNQYHNNKGTFKSMDMNGDGKLDIVKAQEYKKTTTTTTPGKVWGTKSTEDWRLVTEVTVEIGKGDGTFEKPVKVAEFNGGLTTGDKTHYGASTTTPTALDIQDYDGDGVKDVMVGVYANDDAPLETKLWINKIPQVTVDKLLDKKPEK